MESTQSHLLCITNVRINFHLTFYKKKTATLEKTLNTAILTLLSHRSIVTYPCYNCTHRFLPPTLSFISNKLLIISTLALARMVLVSWIL